MTLSQRAAASPLYRLSLGHALIPSHILLSLSLLLSPSPLGPSLVLPVAAFDALDPTGNITIIYDVTSFTGDGYVANVRMYNYQAFRKIDPPGWTLSWNWTNGEYIWSMEGAVAKEQGDCAKTAYPGGVVPYCCLEYPQIVDMGPDQANTYKNCCKNGYLAAYAQDPGNAMAAFSIVVGNGSTTFWSYIPPDNFTLGVDGYKCTVPVEVNATRIYTPDGKRFSQVLLTYEIVCTYNRQDVKKNPSCCVTFSSFYNETIVPCPTCSCACGNFSDSSNVCLSSGTVPFLSSTATGDGRELMKVPSSIICSPDGCPMNIHYHVKLNYQDYWRIKLTLTNRDLWKNHSFWNLAVEHPGFSNITEVFSFETALTSPFGVNNTALFWGMKMYNEILMPGGKSGNVQSEVLMGKTKDFTLGNGWAFPRKVIFNGEECVMPSEFPMLPSSAYRRMSLGSMYVLALAIALISSFLFILL